MTQQILYIDDVGQDGLARFRNFRSAFSPDEAIDCIAVSDIPNSRVTSMRWDLLVANWRLPAAQRDLVAGLIDSDPDMVLVLLVDVPQDSAAETVHRFGAVDCVSPVDGYASVVRHVRRTMTLLEVARRALSGMSNRIEEFDVTLAVVPGENGASSVAEYVLRHLVQTDVCGLRNQLRSIRAFEAVLERMLRYERVLRPAATDQAGVRTRIHLSRAGIRFTLSNSDGMAEFDDLWAAHLFMDEIVQDPVRHELTMLKLPDDVCQTVTQAIAAQRNEPPRNLLGEVLKGVPKLVSAEPDSVLGSQHGHETCKAPRMAPPRKDGEGTSS